MKIGIITFHSAHNYGAMLQAFATQTFLKKLNFEEVKIIDYNTKDKRLTYRAINNPKNLEQFVWFFIKLFHYYWLKKKWNRFKKFYDTKLDKTNRYETFKELKNNPPDFDVIISGSDQVFNPHHNQVFLDTYYLRFCKANQKLVAYAPSFGVSSIPDEKKALIKKYLSHFKALSARETQGCSIIKELTGKIVPRVLDPVFLLKPDEWRGIASHVKKTDFPYILVYALVGFKKQMELANKVKKILDMPIVLITNTVFPKSDADRVVYSTGPCEFIYLFSNASYVLTDSFHGTAFSVLFNIPFFSIIVLPKAASRITSLLDRIALKDRVLYDVRDINIEQLKVDYSKPNKLLQNERKVSINYLKNAILQRD